MDDGDLDGHAKIGADEDASRLVTPVEIGDPAEPEIYRHEHQSRAVSDRYGKGPEPELRRSYPRKRPRMATVDKPEDTEPDDQETGADLDLPLPIDERDQQREGKDHHENCEQMAGRERPERRHEGARIFSISPAETASGHPIPGFTP